MAKRSANEAGSTEIPETEGGDEMNLTAFKESDQNMPQSTLEEVDAGTTTGELMVNSPSGQVVTIAAGDKYRWSPGLPIPDRGNGVIKISAPRAKSRTPVAWEIWVDRDTKEVIRRNLRDGTQKALGKVEALSRLALTVERDGDTWTLIPRPD